MALKKFTAYAMRTMSQVVEFEADEDSTDEELLDAAMNADGLNLDPNISNDFEPDGDIEFHYIKNDAGKSVYGEGA